MSQSDRAIKKLATELARIKSEVVSWRGAQADYTSIEGGTMDINDSEGNLVSRVGYQEDGSGAVRFFDGPTPPVPSGVTATADGPIIQATWDGSFVDGQEATYDLAYLEVAATLVDDDSNVSFATITAKEGASASVVADVTGDWVVAVRSVSQAGKKSEFATAGTVEVKLTDVAGAIEDVQQSANGKNKVTYSSHAPTEDDPGIFDDTWFVGQVGRPNDIIEGKNRVRNPSAVPSGTAWTTRTGSGTAAAMSATTRGGMSCFRATTTAGSSYVYLVAADDEYNPASLGDVVPGEVISAGMLVACSGSRSLSLRMGFRDSAGTFIAWSAIGPAVTVPANGSLTQLKLENQIVPAGATRVYVHVTNSTTSGVGDWVEGTRAFITQGETLPEFFDGDTENGTGPDDPHYRWAGEPHASTSEKYLPALDIGESSNWNIIEQYRHDGNGWVKVELSHYVFSTVDLGKATVGELDGIRIMARTVSSDQLTADFADFMVARGATLIAGNNRHRLDDNGYAIYDDNGDRRTFLSPEGSTFKGAVEAETLVVNDGAEFNGNNTLAQGAKLTLAAGVTDPTAPPVVQPYWDGVEFDYPIYGNQPSTTDVTGLAFDGTNYWTVKKSGNWGAWPDGVYGNAVRINATTGATTGFAVPFTNSNERFGVTCVGSELFWLYRSGYDSKVLVTDLNCAKLREFAAPSIGYSATNPLTYRPGIGNDGTNLVTAQCTDAGSLGWAFISKTNGGVISGGLDRGDATKSDITGVYVGNGDWGAKHVVVAKKSTNTVQVFGTDGSATNHSWYTDNGDVGIVFHDGTFHTLNPAGIVHEYADTNTGDNSGDWWAAYRWYNLVSSFPAIRYWSRISWYSRFAWPRRAKIKIMGQPLPTGVPTIEPMLAKKSSFPERADFRRVVPRINRAGEPVAWYNSLPTNWQTMEVPEDTNTFPEAESSALQSASGTFHLRGDGAGKWGPITFNTNGTIKGATDAGTAIVPINAANTNRTLAVTFTTGRFKTPPTVVATPVTPDPQTVQVSVANITATGFTMVARRTVASDAYVTWVATEG